MFAKVMSVVLGFLGISAFAKDEKGKSILLSSQEEELKNKYGAVFVEAFKKDLAEFEKDGRNAESAVTDEVRAQLEAERDKKCAGTGKGTQGFGRPRCQSESAGEGHRLEGCPDCQDGQRTCTGCGAAGCRRQERNG